MVKNDDRERAMTAIGLLCREYMHMPRTDPAMVEGTAYIMQNSRPTRRPQHLLLVLRHAGDAQPDGPQLGRLEPEDAGKS